MSPLLRLGAVAAVLVVLVLVFANPFQDSIRSGDAPAETLFGDAVADADRIEIAAGTDAPAVLAHGDGGWVVESGEGFPADTAAVGTILRSARGVRSLGVISTNPENRSKFQVDSTGVRVDISGPGGALARFTVGKQGQDFTTSYVRMEGSDEVHSVRGLNRNLFVRPQGLRDRTLLSFDPSSVRSLRLEEPGGGWEIVRTDTVWTVQAAGSADAVPAKPEEVDRLLQTLAGLSADAFLEGAADTADTGLDAPSREITVGFMNGGEAGIAVGGQNERKQYYVSRPDRPAVYLLAEWRMTNALKSYSDLVRDGEGG
jgi:hypothetical protein